MYNNINIGLIFCRRTTRICLCYFVICLAKYLPYLPRICFYFWLL